MENNGEDIRLHGLHAMEQLKLKQKIPMLSRGAMGTPGTEPANPSLEAQFPPIFSLSMPHYNTPNDQAITQHFKADTWVVTTE